VSDLRGDPLSDTATRSFISPNSLKEFLAFDLTKIWPVFPSMVKGEFLGEFEVV